MHAFADGWRCSSSGGGGPVHGNHQREDNVASEGEEWIVRFPFWK